MILFKKIKIYHLAILGSMAIALVSIIFANDVHFRLNFLNSDTMYQQSLYKDLFVENGNWKDWSYNAAPNIFPDFLFMSVLMFLTNNPALSGILYGVIQFGIIQLLFISILKNASILSDEKKLAFIPIFSSILFLPTVFNQEIEHGFQMLSNSYHLGAFVNTLIVLWLISRNFQNPKNILLLSVIMCLAAFSDKVFWVMCCAPLFVLAFFFLIKKQILPFKKYLILSLIPVVVALLLAGLVRSVEGPQIEKAYREFSSDYIIPSLQNFLSVYSELILDMQWRALIYVLVAVSVFISIIHVFRNKFDTFSFKNFLFFFFTISTLSTFAAPILNGSFDNLEHLRYQMGAIIFCMLFLGYLIARLNWNPRILAITIYTPAALAFATCLVHGNELTRKLNYYPSFTEEVDTIARTYQLKNGISTYWNAKLNEMLSRSGIHVIACYNEPFPQVHANSRDWAFHDRQNRNERVIFNFIIINDDFHLEKVKEVFTFGTSLVKYGETTVLLTPPFYYDQDGKLKFE